MSFAQPEVVLSIVLRTLCEGGKRTRIDALNFAPPRGLEAQERGAGTLNLSSHLLGIANLCRSAPNASFRSR